MAWLIDPLLTAVFVLVGMDLIETANRRLAARRARREAPRWRGPRVRRDRGHEGYDPWRPKWR